MGKIKFHLGTLKGDSKQHPIAIHKGKGYLLSHSQNTDSIYTHCCDEIQTYSKSGQLNKSTSYLHQFSAKNVGKISRNYSCYVKENQLF